jgi:hypothetical protein
LGGHSGDPSPSTRNFNVGDGWPVPLLGVRYAPQKDGHARRFHRPPDLFGAARPMSEETRQKGLPVKSRPEVGKN